MEGKGPYRNTGFVCKSAKRSGVRKLACAFTHAPQRDSTGFRVRKNGRKAIRNLKTCDDAGGPKTKRRQAAALQSGYAAHREMLTNVSANSGVHSLLSNRPAHTGLHIHTGETT